MLPLEAWAYPGLLLALYGTYRVGRSGQLPAGFEWVRLCALAILLGVVVAVDWRLAQAGFLSSLAALLGVALGIGAGAGLLGLHMLHLVDARRAAPA